MNKYLLALVAVAGLATVVTAGDKNLQAQATPAAPAVPAAPKPEMKEMDIVDTAVAAKFNTLFTALKAAGLIEALKGKGPFTVFAPTDEAFAKLDKTVLADLLKPENKAKLADILKFHVIAASVSSAEVVKMKESSKTLQGTTFNIVVKDGKVSIGHDGNMANVTKTDIKCSNGVIHIIDAVIMPKADKKDEAKKEEKKDAPKK